MTAKAAPEPATAEPSADEAAQTPGPDKVWDFQADLGFAPSMQVAGTVAAPLLAGFSFTLLLLLLPSLDGTTDRVGVGNHVETFAEPSFSAAPGVAAVLLLLAGLLLVGCVQAAVTMRYHDLTPSDLQDWCPEWFPDLPEGAVPPADVEGWHRDPGAVAVGTRWYPGWARAHLRAKRSDANLWGRRARRLYQSGIVSLLLGLMFLVIPPSTDATPLRWILLGLAVVGVLAELWWIKLSEAKPAR